MPEQKTIGWTVQELMELQKKIFKESLLLHGGKSQFLESQPSGIFGECFLGRHVMPPRCSIASFLQHCRSQIEDPTLIPHLAPKTP